MSRGLVVISLVALALAGCDREGADAGSSGRDGRQGARSQDANKDGKVTLEEARAAQRRMLDRFDANHDGKLGFEEIEALPERMAERAARMDADGDRAVTAAEMDKAADARFRRRDANGDGALTGDEMRSGRHREPGSRASTPL